MLVDFAALIGVVWHVSWKYLTCQQINLAKKLAVNLPAGFFFLEQQALK
jgi:hypothetical protein